MQLQPLTLNDKPVFDAYVHRTCPRLSSYAFAPLYIWQDHFAFYWVELAGYLCIFAKQNDDYFMPILPMPYETESRTYLNVINKAYQFMVESSRNPHIARIENVPQEMLSLFGATCNPKLVTQKFNKIGFCATLKETEYLYETEALGRLSGNRYKSKRSALQTLLLRVTRRRYSVRIAPPIAIRVSHAMTHGEPHVRRNVTTMSIARCLTIRGLHTELPSHMQTHSDFSAGLSVSTARLEGYTFGYPLNADTFCVLFEVTDLNTKGLAQFIYREFCSELMGKYRWINAMDDSGLENLRRVKHSYHPIRLIPSYNVLRSADIRLS